MDLYQSDEYQQQANKTGLLLATTRYREQIEPFVQSTDRLAFAEPEIRRVIKECAEEVDADSGYVEKHLRRIIADSLPQTKPEKIKLPFSNGDNFAGEHGYGGGPASPPLKYDPAKVNPTPDAVSDTSYATGPVLEDEIRDPDHTDDLNAQTFDGKNKNNFSHVAACKCEGEEECECEEDCECKEAHVITYLSSLDDTAFELVSKTILQQDAKMLTREILALNSPKVACVRCGSEKEADGPVCDKCQDKLIHMASPFMQPIAPAGQGLNGQPGASETGMGVPPGMAVCQHCGGQTVNGVCQGCGYQQGSPSLNENMENAHPDQVMNNRMQNGMYPSFMGSTHEGAPADQLDYDTNPYSDPAPIQGPQPQDDTQGNPTELTQFQSPRSHFDDIVSNFANQAAARKFSQKTDDDISQVAETLGLNPDDVAQNVKVIAKFGEITAVNGDLDADDNVADYEEVPGLGGPVEAHEAVVPLAIAIAKVSQDMNIDEQMVMNNLRDSFGDVDPPQEYHAPIQGGRKFYLPRTMMGSQQPLNREPAEPQSEQPELNSDFQ